MADTPVPLLREQCDACPVILDKAIEKMLRIIDGARIERVSATSYFSGGIETEEQLEQALTGLRDECLELIAAGKRSWSSRGTMDREARSLIQRATQEARNLLEREYAEQLDGTFDIRPDGIIADTAGPHLDAHQRIVRSKLVAAVAHFRSGNRSKDEAVTSYLREAAFTTLNRFVALKMLEARDLVQECVSRGQESSGFREFVGLAPGIVQLHDTGYRLYIDSLFDEIGREVRVLFDRRDPASLLWPGRQALDDLLFILNDPELNSVWGQDETIGWVYQYFNSGDDRQRARYDEKGRPKAPQNSYELAVRNQFFTPRYVVQFLTDNTLGRVWYEMRRGETRLRDLEYLGTPPE